MNFFETVWIDLQKVFAFAPVVAALDPHAAGGIATAELAMTALQPTIKAVQDAQNGDLDHNALVSAVTTAVAQSSASLTKMGVMSVGTDAHIQAAAPLINAAVAMSGLAAPTSKAA